MVLLSSRVDVIRRGNRNIKTDEVREKALNFGGSVSINSWHILSLKTFIFWLCSPKKPGDNPVH